MAHLKRCQQRKIAKTRTGIPCAQRIRRQAKLLKNVEDPLDVDEVDDEDEMMGDAPDTIIVAPASEPASPPPLEVPILAITSKRHQTLLGIQDSNNTSSFWIL